MNMICVSDLLRFVFIICSKNNQEYFVVIYIFNKKTFLGLFLLSLVEIFQYCFADHTYLYIYKYLAPKQIIVNVIILTEITTVYLCR